MAGAVVVAAGQGTRMGMVGPKVLLNLAGHPALWWALRAFETCAEIQSIVLVVAEDQMETLQGLTAAWGFAKVDAVVAGGETRTHSVLHGLRSLPPSTDLVAIHDGARPCIRPEDISRVLQAAALQGGAVAGYPCRDTLQQADREGRVCHTPDRSALWAVQTPQCFVYGPLKAAYECAVHSRETFTDDVAVARSAGMEVQLVDCGPGNLKLTSPEDIAPLEARLLELDGQAAASPCRVGTGYDVHRLVEGRKLILCGVEVPYEKGLLGHSDADVAAHALMDALLGACALPDIGALFPDSDAAYAGADSMALLGRVMERIRAEGYAVLNVDVTIICQKPKLAPLKPAMRERLAQAMGIAVDLVGVKATTTEGLGFEGEGLGISSQAVATVARAKNNHCG